MNIPRSSVYYKPKKRGLKLNEELVSQIHQVIQMYPWYGLDRIHHHLKMQGLSGNRKAVHRILKVKDWTLSQRSSGKRPRVRGMVSQTKTSDTRWAIDTTHFGTQRNGWCHVTMVIDCADRQIVGYRVSTSGKARIAMASLEDGLILRKPKNLILRSDNGLVFASKNFVRLCRKWNVRQEYITPYTPEQNGLVERLFKSLKDECLWRNNFVSILQATEAIEKWVKYYNNDRPHRALNMLSPMMWRSLQKQAA